MNANHADALARLIAARDNLARVGMMPERRSAYQAAWDEYAAAQAAELAAR